ncbi:hypothetical protein BD408DRAFT_419250 [Parasitella parasitica]|nr:hypothetical protein BD408DRAFT_419250 [Parasitella parasitica]
MFCKLCIDRRNRKPFIGSFEIVRLACLLSSCKRCPAFSFWHRWSMLLCLQTVFTHSCLFISLNGWGCNSSYCK